jgi:hypothetical protein
VLVDVLGAVFLLLSGTLAGVLFAVEIAVVPTILALAAEPYVRVHTLLDRRFDPLMPRINKVALAICVLLVVFAEPVGAKVGIGLAGVATVGVAVVSEVYNVRMNRRIADWDPRALPADWQSVRARWASANRVRTLIAFAGFAAAITGTTLAWT